METQTLLTSINAASGSGLEWHDYLSLGIGIVGLFLASVAFGAFWGNKVITRDELSKQLEDLSDSIEEKFQRRWDDLMMFLLEDDDDE